MIKVLNVISDTNVGGAGRVILNYLKYRDAANFDVSVALPRGSALIERIEPFGVKVIEVDGIADKSLDFAAIRELKRIIRAEDPDIVHTHGSMSGRIAARQCRKKVIYTRHSAFPVKSYMRMGPGRWLNKLVNEHYADRIIAVSPACADNLTDGGISKNRIDIVMNGVEPVTPPTPEENALFRSSLGLGDGDFTAGILARIEDYKGHIDILRAVSLLRDRGVDVKLLIAGTGGYEEEVRFACKAFGLEDRVIFLGFVTDVAPVLGAIDVQLNASYGTEATSLSLLEGFSMGVPAVVSDYGGNPWLVEDGVNGLIFPTRDYTAMADALQKLVRDPQALTEMGLAAKNTYNDKFTGEHFARSIEEIYTAVTEGKKHGKK